MTALQAPRGEARRDRLVRSRALAVGLLVVAIAVAVTQRERGGLLALGLFAGVLAAMGVAILLATLRPIAALLTAARPLAVPLLLIVAAGTVESPFPLQLAAGIVAMLVAVHYLIRPEWPRVRTWFSTVDRGLTPRTRVRALGVVAVVVAVLVVAAAASPAVTREARGGAAGYFFAVAVIFVVLAAILRLAGYARSWLKLPVAVFMLLAAARAAMAFGLLAGDGLMARHLPAVTAGALLLLAVIVLALAVVVEVVGWATSARRDDLDESRLLRIAVWLDHPVAPRIVTDGASVVGLIAAIVAAAALFVAMALAANPGQATGPLAQSVGASRPDLPRTPPAQLDDAALARAYAPKLLFSQASQWSPVSVDDYLRRAGRSVRVVDWEGRTVPTSRLRQLDDCPGIVVSPCYKVSTGCASGEDGCAQSVSHDPGQSVRDGAVYVRVARRGERSPDGSPDPFDAVGPFGRQTEILVQYWFFYPYDDWVAPVMAGQLRQFHQADWEAVTIGFSASKPLFVGFSEHCGGQWYEWPRVRVAGGRGPRTRTLDAVALGSQANYRYPNPSEAPDWTGCANLPARTLTLVSYASNIRDRTGVDWTWTPKRLIEASADRWPMSFVGRWAPFSRTNLETLYREHTLGPDAAGPATPSLQPLWREPMRTMFKSPHWHRGKAGS